MLILQAGKDFGRNGSRSVIAPGRVMSLGERIAQVRGKVSRKIFAEKLGIHPQTLYLYEKGKRNVSIDVISRLCDDHGISVEWLTKGTGLVSRPEEVPSSISHSDFASCRDAPAPSARGVDVPVLGLAACSLAGWYNPGPMAFRLSFPVDHPYSPDLFAVIAVGTSMRPEGIRQGFVLYCDPAASLAANDVVFVEKKDGTASIKTYRKQDGRWLYLEGWLPPNDEGAQKPYSEQVDIDTVKRVVCVVLVKLKA